MVTLGVAVKATAVIALPFLVWVWAGHLTSTPVRNAVRAIGCALATFVAVFAACTLIAGVDLGWVGMLNSSSRIVNWLSLPTAVGEILHWLVALVVDVPKDYFTTATRLIGMLTLAAVLVRQWWLARDGGPDAVRRAAIALFAVAILSPTTLPWYLTWGMALAACPGSAGSSRWSSASPRSSWSRTHPTARPCSTSGRSCSPPSRSPRWPASRCSARTHFLWVDPDHSDGISGSMRARPR